MRLYSAVLFDDEKYIDLDWDTRTYSIVLVRGSLAGNYPFTDIDNLLMDDLEDWLPDQ